MAGSVLYLVAYDICGPGFERRLRKVYRVMRGYGEHVQYSLFRCVLSALQLARMEGELEAVIDARRDQIMIVPLGSAEAPRSWRMYTLGVPIDAPERVVRVV